MDSQDAPLDPFADLLAPLLAPTSSGGDALGTTDTTTAPITTDSTFLDTTLGFVGQLLQVIADIPKELLGLEQDVAKAHPLDVVKTLGQHLERGLAVVDASAWLPTLSQGTTGTTDSRNSIEDEAFNIWQWISTISGGFFYTAFLKFGLDIDTTQFSPEAKKGVETTDMLIGFTIALQYAIAIIELAGEGIFANRWVKPLKGAISKIPEEMGLSWAMGMNIEEAFSVAVGKSIEEEINLQKRPNRIDWRVLRAILRQRPADRDKIRHKLQLNGFPEEDVDWIMELTDANIPVGDLQQLYMYGILHKDEVLPYIKKLGFSDDDADKLNNLYIDKANTPAGSMLRSTVRGLFRNQLVTEDFYRSILTDTNTPPLEVDEDIRAIEIEHRVGRTNDTTAVIKSRRLHNIIDDGEAVTKLQQIGLTHEAAVDMVGSWLLPPIHPTHGLSQARILSYLISGVLTTEQAGPLLLDTGLNSNAVAMLLAHPNAHPQVTIHRLTPSFVITAYLDGALNAANLESAFTKAGVSSDDMAYWLAVAHYRYSHKKNASGGTLPLTKGEIIDAFKYGIYDEPQALMALENLDYDSTNATILLEIANKGKFQPQSAPAFATVQDAILYLQQHNYTVFPPQDPKIGAAESMIAAQGYTWQNPPTTGTTALPPPVNPLPTFPIVPV